MLCVPLLLLALAARPSHAAPAAQPAPALHDVAVAVPWSWRKIIKHVESGQTSVVPDVSYQLLDNLPTVEEKRGPATPDQFLPTPERCDNCAPGTHPQPEDAGLVNSLVVNLAAQASSRSLPGQFPWHVSLLYVHYFLHFYSCSGSLLSEHWVLTAANCVKGFHWRLVRLGSYRPGAAQERFQATVNTSHIVVHPGYTKGSPQNDIALIKLESPVEINAYRLPIRLPSLNSFTTTYDNRDAWLSGWGIQSKLGTFSANATLGYAKQRVLSNQECAETFGNETTMSILCTTTTNFTDGCSGDSGAPLVVYEGKGIFVQIGILAFESAQTGCDGGGHVGYTRITSYLRWIQNITGIAPGPDV